MGANLNTLRAMSFAGPISIMCFVLYGAIGTAITVCSLPAAWPTPGHLEITTCNYVVHVTSIYTSYMRTTSASYNDFDKQSSCS